MGLKLKVTAIKVGQSIMITIPKPIVEELNIKKGEKLYVELMDSKIIYSKVNNR